MDTLYLRKNSCSFLKVNIFYSGDNWHKDFDRDENIKALCYLVLYDLPAQTYKCLCDILEMTESRLTFKLWDFVGGTANIQDMKQFTLKTMGDEINTKYCNEMPDELDHFENAAAFCRFIKRDLPYDTFVKFAEALDDKYLSDKLKNI